MKLVSEYLAEAEKFLRLAEIEDAPKVKAALLEQAAAYRKLAENRAQELSLTRPQALSTTRANLSVASCRQDSA